MARRNDKWVSEQQALAALSGTLHAIDRAESWLAGRIDATRQRAEQSLPEDYLLPVGRVSTGQVVTGAELVLCGARTDTQLVAVRADLVSSAVAERSAMLDPHSQAIEAAALARGLDHDATCDRRAGPTMVDHAPRGMAGIVGKRSEVSTYPIGQPGCASAVSRRPLPSPGPHGLLSAGWLGLDVGGLSRVDAIGGRAISPQYRVTTTRKTRRGKKGGKRHKIPQ